MKISKRQLRKIIKEEKAKLREENEYFDGSMMDLDDYNSLFKAIDGVVQRYVRMGYDQADVLHALKNIMGDFLK